MPKRCLLLILLFSSLLGVLPANAQPTEPATVRTGVYASPPFVMTKGDGVFFGMAIEDIFDFSEEEVF